MPKTEFEKKILGKTANPNFIRRQNCIGCHTTLAIEITDKLGTKGEYWYIKNGIWVKERWFGNHVKCPVCGLEGDLPMDKPLTYESHLNRKKERENAGSS